MRGEPRALPGLLALLALLASGCFAHLPRLPSGSQLDTDAGRFILEFEEVDRPWSEKVERAVQRAAPALAQWGGLREPVQVFILPSHQALERAVDRRGYPWLRAWARYDEVFLQSPRTWSLFGAAQADVDELILHELTHAVMYQQASDRTKWRRRHIPLWFREGMASWTARQAYRWPSLEDLAGYYQTHPTRDPVLEPEPLYQGQSEVVYAAAHHAFSFLVRRYGQPKVRELLGAMAQGQQFEEAFEQVLGLSHQAFAADFKRFVRLRGFRGGRKVQPPPAPAPPEEG